MLKPKVFVASSLEGVKIAYALQENFFDDDFEVIIWNQAVFQLSKSGLENLTNSLEEFDFGIFVFSPDDALEIRGEEYQSVRDNVLFELGLFIGELGQERCFIVSPRTQDPFRIPTDLLGIMRATYNADKEEEYLTAKLGPACNQIRREIQRVNNSRLSGQWTGTASDIEVKAVDENDTASLQAHFEYAIKVTVRYIGEKIKLDGNLKATPLPDGEYQEEEEHDIVGEGRVENNVYLRLRFKYKSKVLNGYGVMILTLDTQGKTLIAKGDYLYRRTRHNKLQRGYGEIELTKVELTMN